MYKYIKKCINLIRFKTGFNIGRVVGRQVKHWTQKRLRQHAHQADGRCES